MGASVSNLADLATNPYLIKLVGQESVNCSNEYWNRLLPFDIQTPLTNEASFYLEAAVSSLQQRFYRNDLRTHNLATLLQQFIVKATSVLGSIKMGQEINASDIKMARNALLIFRIFTKYILEHRSSHSMNLHFADITSKASNSPSLAEYTVHLLFLLVIEIIPSDITYGLLYESLSSLLILLSAQVSGYGGDEIPATCKYFTSNKCLADAPAFIHRLVLNVAENLPCPPNMLAENHAPGMLWNAASTIASGLMTVVTLGYSRRAASARAEAKLESGSPGGGVLHPLAKQSCHLLLVLTTQSTGFISAASAAPDTDGEDGATSPPNSASAAVAAATASRSIFRDIGSNPYREALFALTPLGEVNAEAKHNGGQGKDLEKGGGNERGIIPPRIPFGRLCETLASTVNTDSSVLLLYLLLHRNDFFRAFVMETRAYEKFTFSICSLLYQSPAENSHLVYMALIVLLILTENENFAKDVHDIPVKKPPPNVERQLTGVSLGSLLVYVLTQTIRHHLNQLRDKYLHINSLAALANLSPKIANLHPYVSQALVDLLQKLVKRHKRLVNEIRTLNDQLKEQKNTTGTKVPPYPDVRLNMMSSSDALLQDLSLLEEVIRMTLEIFNSILTHSLTANTHLIYNLLYQREYLAPIHNHPSFSDLMQNIDTVLGFFASRIEKDLGLHPTETSAVMTVITKSMGDFARTHTLKEFQELKFKYVEEESPDEFFIPYVWSLVYRHSGLGFEQKLLHSFGGYEYCASEEEAEGDVATTTTATETTTGAITSSDFGNPKINERQSIRG
ncbi:Dymeclin [Echinococcus granulosus]|uniref:Dymeclin n=1 Tax=Echinococcus granulosus TaxID=6210 RepID=A0A068WD27_ECHGR|nr:Dymeclin [Echinococcus granulosus]CDS17996.1 dymeclin [Echinococcus granulosus]